MWYYTMISSVDKLFGKIRQALESCGMWEDTLVIFTSDHGDMMGAHRILLKGTILYEEIFRVPLIVRSPHLTAAGRLWMIWPSMSAFPERSSTWQVWRFLILLKVGLWYLL